jgi:hypothetical protein
MKLFNFNFSACGLELGLNVLGFVFADAFLNRLRRSIDEVLGFLESETGNRTYFFNNVDWGRTLGFEDYVEGRLLFCRSGSGTTTSGGDIK